MRLIQEVKEFFEGYEVMNSMFDKKGIRVEIFEATSRSILQVKIIEQPLKGSSKQRSERNMFCDVKVEKNMVKMQFKYKETKLDKEFTDAVKAIKKSDYVVKTLGNQLSLTIIDPRAEEVSKVFAALEPYCRKYAIE